MIPRSSAAGNHIPSPLAGEGRVRGHNYVASFL